MKQTSGSVKSEPAPSATELRRVPVQARGRRTVARILAAASRAFVDPGYDAATTTEIARHAGVSVGSLYQFFPDKEALLEALAARHGEAVDEILAASLRLDQDASLEEIVGLIVERIVAHAGREPIFGVLLAGAGSPPVVRVSERLRSELAKRVERVIAQKPLPPRRRAIVAAVCVDLLAALLPRALDDRGRPRPAIVREAELALVAYLCAVAA
jgi:AcrR family transcriptional regulator